MEGAEYERQLLRDVFGGSSDSDVSEEEQAEEDDGLFSSSHNQSSDAERALLLSAPLSNPSRSWRRIEAINGLWLCTDFLSPQQQSWLLSAIQNEGWFTELSHNQAMRFGDLPFWAIELSDCIHEAICVGDREANIEDCGNEACILPSQLLWRDPFFDQLIANIYQPGDLCSCRPDEV